MSTCIDCGHPAEIEYVAGVVISKDGVEYRYKLRHFTPDEVAEEVRGHVVAICAIRQRDCGCD